MNSEILECFRLLELKPDASHEDVRQAYRELVKVWHPDRFQNDSSLQSKAQEKLKKINLAYEQIQIFLKSRPTWDKELKATVPEQSPSKEAQPSTQFYGMDGGRSTSISYSIPKNVANFLFKQGYELEDFKINSRLKTFDGKPAAGRGYVVVGRREMELNPSHKFVVNIRRVIEVNPLHKWNNTEVHEALHHYINEQLDDPSTSALMKIFLKCFGGVDSEGHHPENLVEAVAGIVHNRLTGQQLEGPAKRIVCEYFGSDKGGNPILPNDNYGELLIASLRLKLGRPNKKDAIKLLAHHLLNNPSYVEMQWMRRQESSQNSSNHPPTQSPQEGTPTVNKNAFT